MITYVLPSFYGSQCIYFAILFNHVLLFPRSRCGSLNYVFFPSGILDGVSSSTLGRRRRSKLTFSVEKLNYAAALIHGGPENRIIF